MAVEPNFTEDQIKHFEKAFSQFDKVTKFSVFEILVLQPTLAASSQTIMPLDHLRKARFSECLVPSGHLYHIRFTAL